MPSKTKAKKASAPADATVLDISQQLAARLDLKGTPPGLPDLNSDTDFRRAYIIGEINADGTMTERVVYGCCWTDMRGAADDDLPPQSGPSYQLWVIEPDAADPSSPGANTYMGMLYQAPDGGLILARPRRDRDIRIDDFLAGKEDAHDCGCDDCRTDGLVVAISDDAPVLARGTNCVRSRNVNLSATVYSGFATSRAAAVAAAATNAQTYADGVASGRGRLESCGGGCNPCSSATANITSISTDSSVSLIASLFYLEWRYTGRADFNYSFSVGCCRSGSPLGAGVAA